VLEDFTPAIRSWRPLLLALFLMAVAAPVGMQGQSQGVAYLAVDLQTHAVLASEQRQQLDIPVLPGSVIKIATLAAALESGILTERTGILCTRQTVVAGHQLTCTHPDLHRPLKASEALAHSCNVFFATIAARLPRAALDRALTDLGLPPTDPGQTVAAAALGVEGRRIAPRRLVEMLARVTADPSPLPWRAATLAAVREGLHGAATYGTASALERRGVDALAKTGTTLSGGVAQGLVVGVWPAVMPTVGFVVLTSGGAGMDAASIAAERLVRLPKPTSRATIRLGIAKNGGGYDVRTLPLEDYVAGVVAGEAAQGSTPAALEALAITVRTFTEANRRRHEHEGFDLCDLTHCQVWRAPTASTRRAAGVTAGQVLLDHGVPASVFYTASCGGHTERPSAVWPGAVDPAFLPSRPDDACDGEPAWSSDIPIADMTRALRTGRFKGDLLRNISVSRRTSSGRASWLHLDGLVPREISGEDLRTLVGRTLGWQLVRSTAFDVRRTGAGFHFEGHGAGHGVGLCVLGATHLAARGQSVTEILSTYFPGLQLSPLDASRSSPTTDIVVMLPSTERGEREAVQRLTMRSLNKLTAALGAPPPARLVLRFRPTVESYERESGQRWFTAASSRGAEIQLLPLTVLRQRGILESVIAHELVHVMTALPLAGRPLWVVEGAAGYFSEERTNVMTTRRCPPDEALRRPASQAALRTAYAAATDCFARQIDAGVSWRDVR
jgi:stage II sporulation protein D